MPLGMSANARPDWLTAGKHISTACRQVAVYPMKWQHELIQIQHNLSQHEQLQALRKLALGGAAESGQSEVLRGDIAHAGKHGHTS